MRVLLKVCFFSTRDDSEPSENRSMNCRGSALSLSAGLGAHRSSPKLTHGAS
jgi:hypothetical protein